MSQNLTTEGFPKSVLYQSHSMMTASLRPLDSNSASMYRLDHTESRFSALLCYQLDYRNEVEVYAVRWGNSNHSLEFTALLVQHRQSFLCMRSKTTSPPLIIPKAWKCLTDHLVFSMDALDSIQATDRSKFVTGLPRRAI